MKTGFGSIVLVPAVAAIMLAAAASAADKPRARDLGVPFDGTPGAWNAIVETRTGPVLPQVVARQPTVGERRPCIMDGSDGIFIVLPIVALIALLILVVLPFVGDRESGDSRSGGRQSLGHQAQSQIPGHSAAADVPGSDEIGPGHA